MTLNARGLTGNAMSRLMQKAGFNVSYKKGHHIALQRKEPFTTLIIPDNQTLDSGTVDALLDDACISDEEFKKLLQRK
ncbi:type II toxin-antitoxin system HicA family toxin [Dehalogenimonas etheniformans]|nr:type II toxin-antitoxin system HicA family toxin [Dehalogenimonas etheniformans]QNT76582.1 type II toxin-antitoxin system HicA family toxin [Dehalogenimonas etheniformans]